ncbi:MAG: hypothetical protein JXB14_03725 [Candidatus Altiarchaeota archaeon]|nr:hypothetical protein [Candidatus Altiarchaeota archaeon]
MDMLCLFVLLAFLPTGLSSTPLYLGDLTIPRDRIPDWTYAGVDGGIPDTSDWPVIDATQPPYNANPACDGGNDYIAMQNAINAAAAAFGDGRKGTVVYLPEGCYDFLSSQTLALKSNVVLKGAGIDKSTITIGPKSTDPPPVIVYGSLGATISVVSGNTRDSQQLTLSSTQGIASGTYLLIMEDRDPAKIDDTTYPNTISQVIRVSSVNGNTITLDRPLRDGFTINQRVQIMNPIVNSGIEDIKIRHPESITYPRDQSWGYDGLVRFNYAVNCWVKNVHLYWGQMWLLGIRNSRDVTVESSKFEWTEYNAPIEVGGAGQVANSHLMNVVGGATDCLVWNNIFANNEQVVKFEGGPIGNVFAYNYARDVRPQASYIMLHGWYPQENLFEGNVGVSDRTGMGEGTTMWHDNIWGKQGPRNIFFRNRITGTQAGGFGTFDDRSWPLIGDMFSFIGNVGPSFYGSPGCNTAYPFPEGCVKPFDTKMTNLWAEKNRYTGLLIQYNTGPTTTLVPAPGVCPQNGDLCAGFAGPRIKTCNGYCYSQTGYDGRKPPSAWADFNMPASLFWDSPMPPPFWCKELPWPAVGADVDDLDNLNILPAERRDKGLPCTPIGSEILCDDNSDCEDAELCTYDLCKDSACINNNANLDGGTNIGLGDVIQVMARWATAGPVGDIDSNGNVGLSDIIAIIGLWGNTC